MNVLPEEWREFNDTDDEDNEGNDNDDYDSPRRNLSTLNTNIGLNYMYRLAGGTFFGIETRYNFTNYRNTGGTDLSGANFYTNFTLGFYMWDGNSSRIAWL